jgi:ATP-dependent helicase/DNAse subunit B
LGVTYLSATQLETFADCPSKYLFKRLKLDTRFVFLSDFALNFGSAVHLTLEALFSKTPGDKLTLENLFDVFRTNLGKLLLLNVEVGSSEEKKNILFFYEKAFEKIAPRILSLEQSIKAYFKPSQTLAVEKDVKSEIDAFSLVGKIDRVDLLEDNTLLILDYKTGSVSFTPDHLAKGKNFQALLYWLGAERAFGLSPSAMLFYDLKKSEVRRGLANSNLLSAEAKKHLTRGHAVSPDKLQDLIDSGVQQVSTLGKQIQSGFFPPKPSSESCRFCDAPLFCRKGLGFE